MARIISQEGSELILEVKIKLKGSLLEMENEILDACNDLGCTVTGEALKEFDADGSPIHLGEVKMTSKGQTDKSYQTPYGKVSIKRYSYQSSKGGKTYCPLDEKARIIRDATPKFAQQISHKYANMNALSVRSDLMENHHRKVSHSYLQSVSEWVGSIAQAKEEIWEYETPKLENAVKSVVLSLDGAYLLMREHGYRESMVGNLSLYDVEGKRLHTIYLGEVPEYGKSRFFTRMETEISRIKKQYPDVLYLGIADGAKNNWVFLDKHTSMQLLDFFHVTEYLAKAAYAAYPDKTAKPKRELWLSEHCSQLKSQSGAAQDIIDEMEKLSKKTSLSKKIKDDLLSALTYFQNHQNMMNYPAHIAQNLPIGSGVTEAACKTLVKQRLCCSGMHWKETGAKVVLSLRALVQSKGRWQQFWERINRYGAVICA